VYQIITLVSEIDNITRANIIFVQENQIGQVVSRGGGKSRAAGHMIGKEGFADSFFYRVSFAECK
jgi:hypothetical protein